MHSLALHETISDIFRRKWSLNVLHILAFLHPGKPNETPFPLDNSLF